MFFLRGTLKNRIVIPTVTEEPAVVFRDACSMAYLGVGPVIRRAVAGVVIREAKDLLH